ncbi:MAG: relaxase/mobilization nuclease domain-containing protein [Lachnospiraceae bacterium]|nr:relaxase/mobilization nuclease domain-containing protein [Lachnospiraceae bacterium]
MNDKTFGTLFNKDGCRKYFNSDAPEKLIRYITRTNGKDTQDLIAWGGAGVLEYSVESVIDQFYFAQEAHTRRGNFGRYMSHELFSFTDEGEYDILKSGTDINLIARQMARDIFEQDHCQVIYGIHAPDRDESHLHIHFAINTVNYCTGHKRHENMSQTHNRSERFNKIISDIISGKIIENECF